jgi:iron complex transport system substrate-binding protein
MERLGWMVGHEERASSLVATLRERLEKVALALVAIHDRPSVFFEVRSGNLLAAGRGSMVSEIIEKAGGSNCIQGDEKLVRINEEEVLRLAPEVYLTQLGPMNPNPAPLEARPRFAALPAALNHRSYTVDERMFSRPGPGNVDAVERLAALLHPEAFGAPNQ